MSDSPTRIPWVHSAPGTWHGELCRATYLARPAVAATMATCELWHVTTVMPLPAELLGAEILFATWKAREQWYLRDVFEQIGNQGTCTKAITRSGQTRLTLGSNGVRRRRLPLYLFSCGFHCLASMQFYRLDTGLWLVRRGAQAFIDANFALWSLPPHLQGSRSWKVIKHLQLPRNVRIILDCFPARMFWLHLPS